MSEKWEVSDDKLTRTFEFDDFKGALQFVNRLSVVAESKNHHPDIRIHSYKKVEIQLSTHETGGVTDKDYELAEEIDKLI